MVYKPKALVKKRGKNSVTRIMIIMLRATKLQNRHECNVLLHTNYVYVNRNENFSSLCVSNGRLGYSSRNYQSITHIKEMTSELKDYHGCLDISTKLSTS